jgi:hypothetical protein
MRPERSSPDGYEAAAHHRLICEQIEDFLAGDDEVLLLFAPPLNTSQPDRVGTLP